MKFYFTSVASAVVYGEASSTTYKNYVFIRQGRPYSTAVISNLLQRHFSRAIQVPFGLNEYRQLATAFMNAKLKHKIALSVEEVIEDDDTLFDAQAGHSTQIAQAHYAKSQYGFKSIDSIVLENFFKCSVEWQGLLGMYWYMTDKRNKEVVVEEQY
jgi:hypothetical protein